MTPLPDLAGYRDWWVGWVKDPLIATHGITFDRTLAGLIVTPTGKVRVCAWHTDFHERATCYLNVDTAAEAARVCAGLFAACGWHVDFATAHDDAGGGCGGPVGSRHHAVHQAGPKKKAASGSPRRRLCPGKQKS